MKLVETNNRQLYKCDVCGKVENWTDEWQWFGSYLEAEAGMPLIYVCSTHCRLSLSDFAAQNLLKIKRRTNPIHFPLETFHL